MTSSPEPCAELQLPRLNGPGLHECGVPTPGTDGPWRPPDLHGSGAFAQEPRRSETDEAHARGYAQGLQDGAEQSEQRLRSAVEAVRSLAEELHAAAARFARDRERNLHGLALAVAHKLFQRELNVDPGMLRDLVTRALELLPSEGRIEVRLHPTDLLALSAVGESAGGESAGLQWVADPSLESGSFMIENSTRIVDGRSDVALRTLYEKLEHE